MTLLDVVIFLPLVAFLVILFLPKDSRDAIRTFSLVSSTAIFLISLGLIGPVLVREPRQVRLRDGYSVDRFAGYPLPCRHRRHQPVAGHTHDSAHAHLRARFLAVYR